MNAAFDALAPRSGAQRAWVGVAALFAVALCIGYGLANVVWSVTAWEIPDELTFLFVGLVPLVATWRARPLREELA